MIFKIRVKLKQFKNKAVKLEKLKNGTFKGTIDVISLLATPLKQKTTLYTEWSFFWI